MKIALIYSENLQSKILFYRLIRRHPDLFASIIRVPPFPNKDGGLVPKKWFIRKIARSAFSYLTLNFLVNIFSYILMRVSGTRIADLARKKAIAFKIIKGGTKELAEHFEYLKPDCVINASSVILDAAVLKIPRIGTLNFHGAPLPGYRGAGNYFWMLIDGLTHAHGTLHYVELGLDTGDIIAEGEKVVIDEKMTVLGLWLAIRETADSLFETTVRLMEKSICLQAVPQEESLAISRSFPLRQDVKRLRRKGRGLFGVIPLKNLVRLAVLDMKDRPSG